MRAWIEQHPVFAFYLLAFAISWAGMIPSIGNSSPNPLLSLLSAGGPTFAAVMIVLLVEGKQGPRRMFAPLFEWRFGNAWYLFLFIFWPIVAGAALGLMALFGTALPDLSHFAWNTLPIVFITMLLSNVWEEIGWRGFALPHLLQQKRSVGQIILFMGLLWSLWHLPLMLNPSSPMSTLPWYAEVPFSLALTVLYTWLYLGTGRSLFSVSLFHALSNTIAWILFELGVYVSSYLWVVAIVSLVALAVWLQRHKWRPATDTV